MTTSAPARAAAPAAPAAPLKPVPADGALERLAPGFRAAVDRVVARLVAEGRTPWVFEAVRTPERQAWLYAQGRTRPGGIVTHAASHLQSWHGHGMAVDIICRVRRWDDPAFFRALGRAVEAEGLTWGGGWATLPDAPHLQWGGCPVGPRREDRLRTAQQGMAATWAVYGVANATIVI